MINKNNITKVYCSSVSKAWGIFNRKIHLLLLFYLDMKLIAESILLKNFRSGKSIDFIDIIDIIAE